MKRVDAISTVCMGWSLTVPYSSSQAPFPSVFLHGGKLQTLPVVFYHAKNNKRWTIKDATCTLSLYSLINSFPTEF